MKSNEEMMVLIEIINYQEKYSITAPLLDRQKDSFRYQ
jgi:hypothetical protein